MATDAKSIGKRLVMLRDVLGISQIEVCNSIGVKANRYSQYETGERRLTLDVATKLVIKYRVTLDWLYLDDASGLSGHLQQKILRAA